MPESQHNIQSAGLIPSGKFHPIMPTSGERLHSMNEYPVSDIYSEAQLRLPFKKYSAIYTHS